MPLNKDTVFHEMTHLQYAVRGPIVIRASQIDRELREGSKKYPFDRVISCNVGNPQTLGNGYLTFPREVLSLLNEPKLLDNPKIHEIFKPDVIERARKMHKATGHSGGYTSADGLLGVREAVAHAIERRDNKNAGKELDPCAVGPIFLTDGASQGIQLMIRLLINDPKDGIMCPLPQYPLYPASIQMCNGTLIPYYLDESKNWGINLKELETQFNAAKAMGITARGLCVINPGNPTGRILDVENMDEILVFCYKHGLMLIADEVYQDNVYTDKKWHSFRERLLTLGSPYKDEVQLVSLHSTSKGMYGECGKRGGYLQMINFPKDLFDDFLKLPALNMCANINGQWLTQLMMEPPQEGDPSYPQFKEEYTTMFNSYVDRAVSVCRDLNTIRGVHCLPIEGAFYAFARLDLPKGYIKYAESEKKCAADDCWCMELLESSGLVTLSGTGFGQVPGTYHFRTTILPRAELMKEMVQKVKTFQEGVWEKFGKSAL